MRSYAAAFVPLIFTCLIGCGDRSDTAQHTAPAPAAGTQRQPDNTAVNERDRATGAITPTDQAENEKDRTITQNIRQMIVADDSLSTNAHNVKIITANGVVTLRGPVNSAQEKQSIETKAQEVAGVSRIDNELEIASR